MRQSFDVSGSLLEQLAWFAGEQEPAMGGAHSPPARSILQRRRQTFAAWLGLNLEQQSAALQEYLAGRPDGAMLIDRWRRDRWYERLMPADAGPAEKALFLSDFDLVASLVSGDLPVAGAQAEPGTCRRSRAGCSPQISCTVPILVNGITVLLTLLPVAHCLGLNHPAGSQNPIAILAAEAVVCGAMVAFKGYCRIAGRQAR